MAGRGLDREDAIRKLNNALRLQNRSIIEYTLVAASMTGFQYVGITPKLSDFAREEADDARRLAEKIASFAGEPTGRRGRSEALEQVDFLERAKRTS